MSSLVRSTRILAVLSFALTGFLSLSVLAQQARTVNQGVYTEEQAKRGQTIYVEKCATCHGAALEGRLGPPLSGNDFVGAWEKEPLSQLVSKIQKTMPQADPGKLTAQQSVDIVAYMLQVGKFPAGQGELRSDEAVLKAIVWPPGQSKATASSVQGPALPPTGNLAQVMRGIFFPSSNIIFTVQSIDPAAATKPNTDEITTAGGFNWAIWGNGIYKGWDLIDYAAIALADSAPLMLTPGRRCENGKPVPVSDPEWVQFTLEMAEAGKAAYKASQTRNQQIVSDVTNQVADACLNCHVMYRDKRVRTINPADPSNKAARCVK
jgi:mono/diheme cytochrome c family protein